MTFGIAGGTLINTLKKFTFPGLSNLRTAAKNKEETLTAARTEKVVFICHRPEEALKIIDPRERINQSQKFGFPPTNIVGVNPLENTPVQYVTIADEYLKMRREGVTFRGRYLCSSS